MKKKNDPLRGMNKNTRKARYEVPKKAKPRTWAERTDRIRSVVPTAMGRKK